ncbi:uncharacterized protein N7511_003605 [Penicillium nucicola]|uniref:uncharacterized protein n=1 Tax=Penicillium nucicola TaxID=1850975 RepID=UPI002545943B|nr:uncharacterized protein N7511_003605 [Penicillium nucicola]KAJ5765989.1 hypothetical protein N7511_003605 [Penicillium nucicola]
MASCFYSRTHRNADIDAVLCIPFTEASSGSITEILYTIKYPEYKENGDKWVIRQTGVYQRYDSATSQSLCVLLSPTPQSKLQCEAMQWLSMSSNKAKVDVDPFWLHQLLFTAYFPAWRIYIMTMENKFLPVAKEALVTVIEEPLGLGHDAVIALNSLETRFRQVPALLSSAMDLLQDLSALIDAESETSETKHVTQCLKNHVRYCKTYSQSANYLQQQAKSVAKLLSGSLLARDQLLAQEQNKNILELNKSAVFITRLTLFYLPTSFVATFFGMNFFDMDIETSRIVGTSMIWIFFLSSLGLTAVTYLLYYWLIRHDGAAFHLPKMRLVPAWKFHDIKRQMRFGTKEARDFYEGEA